MTTFLIWYVVCVSAFNVVAGLVMLSTQKYPRTDLTPSGIDAFKVFLNVVIGVCAVLALLMEPRP